MESDNPALMKKGSTSTIEDLVTIISKKEGFNNFEIETTKISTNGANYMGDLVLIDVVEEGKDTLKLFAKLTNIPESAREIIPGNEIYKNEDYIYTTVANAFEELQEKNQIPKEQRFKFVKYYGSSMKKFEEIIILENLIAQDYEVYDRFKSIDWEYAKAALKEIAKFHALSFALKNDNPELFETISKKVKNPFNENADQEGMEEMANIQIEACMKVIDDKHKGKIEKYLKDNKDTPLYLHHVNFKSNNSVIFHGDYRVSNILVQYSKNGDIISLKPIDYQTASFGSPVLDIIYLIFTSTDENFRRQYFDDCFEFYYNSLADHLKLLSLDAKHVYPKFTFYFDLKDRLTFGIDLCFFILCTVLLESEDKIDVGEMVSIEAATNTLGNMKASKLFVERLNGIINDFERWGFLTEDNKPIESPKSTSSVENREVKKVEKIVNTIAKKEKFGDFKIKITPISTGGANFLGELFLVDVTGSGKNTLNLFAKASNIKEDVREVIPANYVYKSEVFVYTTVAEAFHELQERFAVPKERRFQFVKYYSSSLEDLEEVIILENMVAQGYEVYDRFQPVTWEYAKAAIEELAKFHALSFSLQKEMPDVFEKVQSTVTNPLMKNMKTFADSVGEVFFSISFDLIEPENCARWKKYVLENKYKFISRQFDQTMKHKVIVHGDYRMSNILHKYNKAGDIVSLLPVDYQTAFCGNPLIDVLYFLFTGSDEEFRRLHFERYFEHYHNSLAAQLKLLALDIDYIYPKSVFYSELKKIMPFGMDIAIYILGTVLLEPNKAMKMEDIVDEEMMKEAVNDYEPSKAYKERLNGIVRDYVRWGYLEDESTSEEQSATSVVNGINHI